jgi:MFS family permease
MSTQCPTDWRTIVALNSVSAIAQVGQFGIAFVVLPLWLAQQGLNAGQLGLFASSLWFGQLPALAIAPLLIARFGARQVTLAGLFATIIALALIPYTGWNVWLPAGALAGFGIGLRWMGVEPWLYHIAPSHARGRLVGFHETLISLAPIIAPALAAWAGVTTRAPFVLGIGFTCAAVLPLVFARPAPAQDESHPDWVARNHAPRDRLFLLGVSISLVGGAIEAAFAGLFPLFGAARNLDAININQLLILFGIGGLLMQYAAGWIADHRGLPCAASACAGGTVLAALLTAQPSGNIGLGIAIFLLGGFITAFLTLALIAATTSRSGQLENNVSRISMIYSGSAIVGPILTGATMQEFGDDLLVMVVGLLASALYVAVRIVSRTDVVAKEV